ncbi:MAG: recombinase family protein [Lachnospiraceae bacterium]|nr:recombinase family protein [Lachnospiraceae bacterium]
MQNKIMGYARVSTKEQNLDRQLVALSKYVPPENIVVDKVSGKSLDRPGYTALKGPLGLRAGDVLYIKSLDRLSRRKIDIKKELQWFKDNGIRLMIIDLPTSMIRIEEGKGNEWIVEMIENIIIEVLASIAEQERETTLERQREGIDAAKAKGKYLGRPRLVVPDNWDEVMEKWNAGEISAKKAMELLGLKRSSFYKLVKAEFKREL